MTTGLPIDVVSGAGSAPYPPGWTDRLQSAVDRLPVAPWLVYAALAVAVFVIIASVKWLDGTFPLGVVAAFHALPGATLAYGLMFMHYLDRSAARALRTYSVALMVGADDLRRLEYRLTVLPASTAALSALAGAAFLTLVYFSLDPAGSLAAELYILTSPTSRVLEYLVAVTMWAVLGTLIYHTAHQLRVVSDIYVTCTAVNLFRLDPLYAFSALAARTSAGILVLAYTWFFVQPRSQQVLTSWPYTLGFSLLAVITFVLPLLGIHGLLEREKKRLRAEASRRLEAAVGALHTHADARDYTAMDGHYKLLSSLSLELAALDKISTWPWQPETPRLLATAVLTPLLVFLAQRLLALALGL